MGKFEEMIAKYGLDPEMFNPPTQNTDPPVPIPVVVQASALDTLTAMPPVSEDVARALAEIPDEPSFMTDPLYGSDEGQSETAGQPDPSWPPIFRTDPSGKPDDDDEIGDLGPIF